jgi:hypothetical protein
VNNCGELYRSNYAGTLFFQELMMGIHCLNHNRSTDQNRSNIFFIFLSDVVMTNSWNSFFQGNKSKHNPYKNANFNMKICEASN